MLPKPLVAVSSSAADDAISVSSSPFAKFQFDDESVFSFDVFDVIEGQNSDSTFTKSEVLAAMIVN